jgi:hypothetical protein
MTSPTPIEESQAKSFMSGIFEIFGEILETARKNKSEIIENAGVAIDRSQSASTLFRNLASEIQDDETTVTMIHSKRNNYQERILQALEAKHLKLEKGDVKPDSRLETLLDESAKKSS